MKEDKIWSVMNTEERETAHETFNWRFDAMFGEDSRHASGRLQYVHKASGKTSLHNLRKISQTIEIVG